MTSDGLHDTGGEWVWKTAYRQDLISARDAEIEVLLYLDSWDHDGDGTVEGDALTDASDIGDISTEPGDGNYARQSFTLDSADFSLSMVNGDIRVQVTGTFDTTNTTGHIDAAAAVVDLQSDIVNSEGSQNPHLLTSAKIGNRDLSQNDTVDFELNNDIN